MTKHLAILGMLAMVCGCAQPAAVPDLDVRITNLTGDDLEKAEISFGVNRFVCGYLIKGASDTHLYYRYPITSNAVVAWTLPGHTAHTNSVSVTPAYDLRQNGLLTFEIGPTNVEVKFKNK
jgi:hypothetical protein